MFIRSDSRAGIISRSFRLITALESGMFFVVIVMFSSLLLFLILSSLLIVNSCLFLRDLVTPSQWCLIYLCHDYLY